MQLASPGKEDCMTTKEELVPDRSATERATPEEPRLSDSGKDEGARESEAEGCWCINPGGGLIVEVARLGWTFVPEEQGARVRETKREGTGHRPGGLSHTDTLKEFRQRK
jgi:hypothetical protein